MVGRFEQAIAAGCMTRGDDLPIGLLLDVLNCAAQKFNWSILSFRTAVRNVSEVTEMPALPPLSDVHAAIVQPAGIAGVYRRAAIFRDREVIRWSAASHPGL
jgi:hypothetical protein